MTISVLVMTPVRSFGELIQQALQDTDLYRVTLVHESDDVLARVDADSFPVAVLDFDLDPNPSELVARTLALDDELRIIAMKDESDVETSSLEGLSLAAHLDGAFYLPDLLDALEEVTADLKGSSPKAQQSSDSTFPSTVTENKKNLKPRQAPEWLHEVDRAAQHLTRLSLESAAQAALITRGHQLWAYAGQLPQPAADELAQSVGHYWARDGGSDLARFIRLDATSGEYMLYATGLGGDYVLALAFETEIPFSEIRSQANELARELSHPPKEPVSPQKASAAPKTEIQPEKHQQAETNAPDNDLAEFPSDWRPDQDVAKGRQAFFDDLLSTVDIPGPDGAPQPSASQQGTQTETIVEDDFSPENGAEDLSTLAAILDSQNDIAAPTIGEDRPELPETQTIDESDQDELSDLADILDSAKQQGYDDIYLQNLIDTTMSEEVPEIAGYTADLGKAESPLPVLEDPDQTPAEDEIPDFLTDVSLDEAAHVPSAPVSTGEKARKEPSALTGDELETGEALPDKDDTAEFSEALPSDEAKTVKAGSKTTYPIPESLADLMGQKTTSKSDRSESQPEQDKSQQALQDDVPIPDDSLEGEKTSKPAPPPKTGQEAHPIPAEAPLPDHLKDTVPTPVGDRELDLQPMRLKIEDLEPASPTLHSLTYACVLVPRLPQHHLVGDLAINLNQWIMQLGLAFGWRLEHLAIRPNYLHWVAVVPPATSPGHMVRNLREHASQRIFADFPKLARENPSGDFWAPGYLIVNGNDSLSHGVVQDFIRKTRIRQGTSKPGSRKY